MSKLPRLSGRECIKARTSVKVVGSNGQISLGKEFAGRQVLVEEQAPGVWLVRTALVVPDEPVAIWDGEPKRTSVGHDSIHDVKDLKGIVPKPAKPVSIEDMNYVIRRMDGARPERRSVRRKVSRCPR